MPLLRPFAQAEDCWLRQLVFCLLCVWAGGSPLFLQRAQAKIVRGWLVKFRPLDRCHAIFSISLGRGLATSPMRAHRPAACLVQANWILIDKRNHGYPFVGVVLVVVAVVVVVVVVVVVASAAVAAAGRCRQHLLVDATLLLETLLKWPRAWFFFSEGAWDACWTL